MVSSPEPEPGDAPITFLHAVKDLSYWRVATAAFWPYYRNDRRYELRYASGSSVTSIK